MKWESGGGMEGEDDLSSDKLGCGLLDICLGLT